MKFIHDTLPQRVILASGHAAERVTTEVTSLGASRIMVIAGEYEAELADRVTGALPNVVLRWDEVRQHVPVELAQRARTAALEAEIDAMVCVGGGSTTGLAKAVAMEVRVPIVAVPTTYAGSEATNVWGLTEDTVKRTGVDAGVLPQVVVYDAALTTSLPPDLSVASGLNALAHCVDSLWAPRADPINLALVLEGARGLASGLARVTADPEGLTGREETLYGCYLAAVGFASAGSGMHHKICHVLGGAYDLPHAQTHAVILPYVLAYNAPAVPNVASRLAVALGGQVGHDPARSAVAALNDLRDRLDAPRALAAYGFDETDIPDAANRCLAAIPPSNPVPVTQESLETLLRAAWAGTSPAIRS